MAISMLKILSKFYINPELVATLNIKFVKPTLKFDYLLECSCGVRIKIDTYASYMHTKILHYCENLFS